MLDILITLVVRQWFHKVDNDFSNFWYSGQPLLWMFLMADWLITLIKCCSVPLRESIMCFSQPWLNEWLQLYIACLNLHWSGVLTMLTGCDMTGAMWNCCHLGAHPVHTICPCVSWQCSWKPLIFSGLSVHVQLF